MHPGRFTAFDADRFTENSIALCGFEAEDIVSAVALYCNPKIYHNKNLSNKIIATFYPLTDFSL
jgi:hypothetical protein